VGTDRITTIPARLAGRCAEVLPLKLVPLPIEMPRLVEALHWHRVHDGDPAHVWVRSVFRDVVGSMRPGRDTRSAVAALHSGR